MLGKEAEADSLYRKALSIRLDVLPAGHPETVINLQELAKLLFKMGRFGVAGIAEFANVNRDATHAVDSAECGVTLNENNASARRKRL